MILVAILTVERDSVQDFRAYERRAAAIMADYGAKIERTVVVQSEPMNFPCTLWRVAADDLARRHNLLLKVEGGVMYVSKR